MSIGKKLKTAREKKKLKLNQAYEHTRIHPDVLNALENDEYDKISNPTYIRSFLKKYASYLGLDANAILEEYKKLKAQKAEYQDLKVLPGESQKLEAVKALPKTVTAVFKWAIILVLAAVILKGVVKGVVKGAFKIAQNIKVQSAPKQAKPKQPKAGTKLPFALKTSKPKQAEKAPQPQEAVVKAANIPKGEKLILSIKAADDVWFRLKADGKIIFESILKKGKTESWEAEKDFTIQTQRAEALQLTLNRNYIGAAGKGVVKNLTITREGIRK